MRALIRAIEGLSGRYLAAEDVGMTLADLEVIALETGYVFGRNPKAGFGGEPSPMTAFGVLLSIKACVRCLKGRNDLGGVPMTIEQIFEETAGEGLSPDVVADRMAQRLIGRS
jgi:leucine dehydrogenase